MPNKTDSRSVVHLRTGGPRVAVIGCGQWGRNIVRNLAELGALGALVDRHPEIVEMLIAKHGGAAMSFDEVLADPAIDAVAVAVPPTAHYAFAKAALEAGKHVYVEKPLTLHVGEAEELCRTADRLDRRLMVGHILQYHPAFLQLQKLVHDGVLGRLQYIYSNRANLGRICREEDIFWDLAPHDLSMILSLFGSEPASVDCVGGYHLNRSIADVTTLHLTFPEGQQAHVFVSWLYPIKEQKLVVVGDRGMAVFNDAASWSEKLQLFPHRVEWRDAVPVPERGEPVNVIVDQGEPLRLELQHFLDCIRTGRPPRTDGPEAARVVRVLAQAGDALRRRHEAAAVASVGVRSVRADRNEPVAAMAGRKI